MADPEAKVVEEAHTNLDDSFIQVCDPAAVSDPEPSPEEEVVPVADHLITSKDLKKEVENITKEDDGSKESEKIKSTIIISGVIVAVLGAIFAFAKNIKKT